MRTTDKEKEVEGQRKPYKRPEIQVKAVDKVDVLCGSVENFSSYIDPNSGDWGDPIIDPDDDIEW